MSRAIFLLCAQVGPGAAGGMLLLWAPFGWPPPHWGSAAAGLLGSVAGVGLFVALARRWQVPFPRAPIARAVALAVPAVVLGAMEEEAAWRYAAFGVLRPKLGPGATLAASTTAFALAHLPRLGVRALRSHLVTGALFGSLYLVTGRISAPIAGHALYNLLVVAGAVAWGQPGNRLEATR